MQETNCVTKPAWHERRKDTSNTDERQSGVNSSKQGETCCGWNEDDMLSKIDCRIQGLPHSTVEQEDHTRKEPINKLLHQFGTHPGREALKADLRQNQAYNPISVKSKTLIHSMVNEEYFEMCEFSPEIQQRKRDK